VKSTIHDEFLDGGSKTASGIAARVVQNLSLLEQVVAGAKSPKKRVKNAAAKTLKIISEAKPKA